MKHICIDIETLGTKPGSVILSIGAVQFDIVTGETGKQFYINIDAVDSQKNGLTIDASTALWWMKQSDEARKSLEDNCTTLKAALNSFEAWLEDINDKDVQIWANAPSFDLILLRSAYEAIEMGAPWFYWQERCIRTLIAFNPILKKQIVNEFPHNAMGDCLYQIKYCVAIYNSINIK
jgi:hypothetical protein